MSLTAKWQNSGVAQSESFKAHQQPSQIDRKSEGALEVRFARHDRMYRSDGLFVERSLTRGATSRWSVPG